MNSVNKTSRILGVAFLLQAITSLISGLILKLALIVAGNINESMITIAKENNIGSGLEISLFFFSPNFF